MARHSQKRECRLQQHDGGNEGERGLRRVKVGRQTAHSSSGGIYL